MKITDAKMHAGRPSRWARRNWLFIRVYTDADWGRPLPN